MTDVAFCVYRSDISIVAAEVGAARAVGALQPYRQESRRCRGGAGSSSLMHRHSLRSSTQRKQPRSGECHVGAVQESGWHMQQRAFAHATSQEAQGVCSDTVACRALTKQCRECTLACITRADIAFLTAHALVTLHCSITLHALHSQIFRTGEISPAAKG